MGSYGVGEGDGTFAWGVYDSEEVDAQRNASDAQQCRKALGAADPIAASDNKASGVVVSNIVVCI